MMDVWEEQIKSADPISSRMMLGKLKSFPNFGSWPEITASQSAAMNPMQLYAQFAQQWQKGWTEAG